MSDLLSRMHLSFSVLSVIGFFSFAVVIAIVGPTYAETPKSCLKFLYGSNVIVPIGKYQFSPLSPAKQKILQRQKLSMETGEFEFAPDNVDDFVFEHVARKIMPEFYDEFPFFKPHLGYRSLKSQAQVVVTLTRKENKEMLGLLINLNQLKERLAEDAILLGDWFSESSSPRIAKNWAKKVDALKAKIERIESKKEKLDRIDFAIYQEEKAVKRKYEELIASSPNTFLLEMVKMEDILQGFASKVIEAIASGKQELFNLGTSKENGMPSTDLDEYGHILAFLNFAIDAAPLYFHEFYDQVPRNDLIDSEEMAAELFESPVMLLSALSESPEAVKTLYNIFYRMQDVGSENHEFSKLLDHFYELSALEEAADSSEIHKAYDWNKKWWREYFENSSALPESYNHATMMDFFKAVADIKVQEYSF